MTPPPRPTLEQAVPTVARILATFIDFADTAPALNENLKRNRDAIELVGRYRPDLWQELADQSRRRRRHMAEAAR